MDLSEFLIIILVAFVSIILISASAEDLKTRTVRNTHWMAIGSAGIVVHILVSITDGNILSILPITAISVIILYEILSKSDYSVLTNIVFIGSLIIFIILSGHLATSDVEFYTALSVPVFSVIFLIIYYTGLLKGGADAKCMISLTVAFPAYPMFSIFPIFNTANSLASFVFSFPLAILFHALILTMLMVVPFLYVNIKNGNTGRLMFSGYVTSIEKAKRSHVWPMYDIEDGELIRISAVDDTEAVYDRLEKHGKTDIWVTPKIPFILPISISFLITVIIGNPLFLIL